MSIQLPPLLCNSLFFGISKTNYINRLQHIQNIIARVVTGTNRYQHITPILQHYYFQDTQDCHACLPGWSVTAQYLMTRSATHHRLQVNHSHTAFGRQAFNHSSATVSKRPTITAADPGFGEGGSLLLSPLLPSPSPFFFSFLPPFSLSSPLLALTTPPLPFPALPLLSFFFHSILYPFVSMGPVPFSS